VIRDSHDPKYFVIKDHPEHNKAIQQPKRAAVPEKTRNRDNRREDNRKREEPERRER